MVLQNLQMLGFGLKANFLALALRAGVLFLGLVLKVALLLAFASWFRGPASCLTSFQLFLADFVDQNDIAAM